MADANETESKKKKGWKTWHKVAASVFIALPVGGGLTFLGLRLTGHVRLPEEMKHLRAGDNVVTKLDPKTHQVVFAGTAGKAS